MRRRFHKGPAQRGSAMIIALMMLVLLGMIGMAAMDVVAVDRQVAGFATRGRIALDAADAGLATAMGTLRANVQSLRDGGVAALVGYLPAVPATNLGSPASYPYGQPSFGADPSVPNPIRYLGAGKACPWVMSLDGIAWRKTLWEIRVQGQTIGGTTARVQSSASVCHPFNG